MAGYFGASLLPEGQTLMPLGVSRQQRRAWVRKNGVRPPLAPKSAAESTPGPKESILTDATVPAKLPHPVGYRRLFATLPCDFCRQPSGNSDGSGPVCYHCWNAIYLPPGVSE